MDLTPSGIGSKINQYKFPLELLAFDLGVSYVDIAYAQQTWSPSLVDIGKIMVASPAGRILGVKLFGYSFNQQTPDISKMVFNNATYAAIAIYMLNSVFDGAEINAASKFIGPLLAYSVGKGWDPGPVNGGTYGNPSVQSTGTQLTYGCLPG
jgi:hypothetical protein